jgi:hypothetical protein
MPLPTTLMPEGLPPFLIAGHADAITSPFTDVEMTTGHRRKRRVSSARPSVRNVSLFLERDQMTTFQRWFRDPLVSGQRHFSARVKNEGPGMLWFEAVFVGTYEAEALHFGRWIVRAQLYLVGDGQEDPPSLESFHSEVSIPLTGVGTLNVPKRFSSEVTIALTAIQPES